MAAILKEVSGRAEGARRWPAEGITRVPAWLYTDADNFEREMQILHWGKTWNFVAAECELPNPGSWKRSAIGPRSIVVARGKAGEIHAFENRCSHRGAAVVWKHSGTDRDFTCPYHQWNFDLAGNLNGLPFQRGMAGVGGMPADFDKKKHGLRKLRTAVRGGGVFATFSDETLPFEEYAGPEIIGAMDRNSRGRKAKLLGISRQVIRGNWKAWIENARDPYHATLLHTFLTAFGLFRADLPPARSTFRGAHSQGVTYIKPEGTAEAKKASVSQIKSMRDGLVLEDMDVVSTTVDDYGDNMNMGFQLFPSMMYQQHLNMPSWRHIVPKSVNETEVHWTFFGFEGDDEAMTKRRLKQANLVGPAGFVLVEDGEVIGKVQRTVEPSPETLQVLEMGGDSIASVSSMVVENGIRAFYTHYREVMGY